MSRSKLHKKSLKDYQDGGYRARPRYIPLNIGLEVGNFNIGDYIVNINSREIISGNYCRCTGYQAIVDAVEDSLNKINVGT